MSEDELENINEEQADELPKELEEKKEQEIEVNPPEKATARGDKKVIEALLKKKTIWIGIAIGGGLFVIILFVALFQSTGVTEKPYYETSCQNVTITYDPYNEDEAGFTKTMDIEEYIQVAVTEYTKNILNPPSGIYQVYYALAVALRTEVVSQDCKITYRDKKLDSSPLTSVQFNSAMSDAKSVIVSNRQNKILSVKVSDFCWQSTTEEDYHLFGSQNQIIPSSFILDYYNNDILRDCPCNQPDESLDSCWTRWEVEKEDEEGNIIIEEEKEWLHYDSEESFSVYGAYYLMMQYNQGYDAILKYFLSDDLTYMTISKKGSKETEKNTATNCSKFSLTETTLSREDFVNKIENYNYQGRASASWNLFRENAGHIYDMAVSNHVNPEMIYVRAILEGFSPGGSKHNYFGINCVNEHPEKCNTYSSFDDGIMGFIKVVKKYFAFETFARRYAYLGDYWFNPGNAGDGGCYYAKYIYPEGMDSYVADACSETRKGHCTKSDRSMCVLTREQDKTAYALYQGKNMTNLRYRIFGIEENSCSNNTLNYGKCTLFSQGDSRWGQYTLGNGPSNIKSAGCALTSLAIALTCTGSVTSNDFSPLVLNHAMTENGGFDGDLIYWNNDALRDFVPTFTEGSTYKINKNDSDTSKIEVLKNLIGQNKIGIVHIENSAHTAGHYVVLQSIDEQKGTISVLDPAGGKVAIYTIQDVEGNQRYYTY